MIKLEPHCIERANQECGVYITKKIMKSTTHTYLGNSLKYN